MGRHSLHHCSLFARYCLCLALGEEIPPSVIVRARYVCFLPGWGCKEWRSPGKGRGGWPKSEYGRYTLAADFFHLMTIVTFGVTMDELGEGVYAFLVGR